MAFTEKYVTVTGGGLHDGSSEANAWNLAEWYAAQGTLSAGTRTNIKAGAYPLTTILNSFASGSTTLPMCIRGYKQTIGDLDGRGEVRVPVTDMPQFQTTLVNTYFYMNASFIIIENLAFTSSVDRPAAYTEGGRQFWNGCQFESTYATPSAGSGCIRRNLGDYSTFYKCSFKDEKYSSSSLTSSTTFVGCVFEFYGFRATEFITLTGNVFKNNGHTGPQLELLGYGGFSITGNTFYNMGGNAITVTNANYPIYNLPLVANNVFHTIGGNAIQAYATSNAAFYADSNLFYNVTGSQFANDSFGLNRNPLSETVEPFVDASNENFRLISTSLGYGQASPRPFEGWDVNTLRDVGAVQHADPTGGGGATVHPLYAN